MEIADLHVPFKRWLDSERILYITPRSDRESTIAEGWPDFTIMLAGRVLLLEFKTDKGSLSPAQKMRHAECTLSGCTPVVCRSIQAAVEVVNAWRATVGEVAQMSGHAKPAGAKLARMSGFVWELTPRGWVRLRAETPTDCGLPVLR